MSDPGSRPGSPGWSLRARQRGRPVVGPPGPARGFTLIELMVVVAIVAIVTGLVSLAVRDPDTTRLEQEAARLAALLESARAEARASGLAVRWVPQAAGSPPGADTADFRFVGLPAASAMPQRWLSPEVRAEVVNGTGLVLGPEPVIGAQRVLLHLADRRLTLATDGLGPFSVAAAAGAADTAPALR